jgi:hypothetical protein
MIHRLASLGQEVHIRLRGGVNGLQDISAFCHIPSTLISYRKGGVVQLPRAFLLERASAFPWAAPDLWTTEKSKGCKARNQRVTRAFTVLIP